MGCLKATGGNGLDGTYNYNGITDEWCRDGDAMIIRRGSGGWDFCSASSCTASIQCSGNSGRSGHVGNNVNDQPNTGNIGCWGCQPQSAISYNCQHYYCIATTTTAITTTTTTTTTSQADCLKATGGNGLDGTYNYNGITDEWCRDDDAMIIRRGSGGWDFCSASPCIASIQYSGNS